MAFVVHSFAGDDPLVCRDHVREKAGLEPFKPNGSGRQRASNDAIERALMAAVAAQRRDGNKHRIVAKYDYADARRRRCFIRCCGLNRKVFASAGRTATVAGFGSSTSGACCIAGRSF